MAFRAAFVVLACAALSACALPLNAVKGAEDTIEAEFGPPRQPLSSGLYRFTGFVEEDGDVTAFVDMIEADDATAGISEYFVLQWHAPSRSHAGLFKVARVRSAGGRSRPRPAPAAPRLHHRRSDLLPAAADR